MRKTSAAVAALLALLLAAACGPPAGDGPAVSWNDPNDDACVTRDVPAVPAFTTYDKPRPPLLQTPERADWPYQTISFEARALPPVDLPTGTEHCVPIALHVMVTGPTPDDTSGPFVVLPDGVTTGTLPYDTITTTPWVGAYVILAYNPKSERFSSPPTYSVVFEVTYLEERDAPTNNPVGIRCAIHVADTEVTQVMTLTASSRFVHCDHTGRTYRP